MTPTKPLFLSAAVFLTACISLPDIDSPQAEVQVLIPSEPAYTNGTLDLQLEVTGTPPDRVELLAGDEVLTTLEPPYTFQWDTTSVPEGRYRVAGRVHIAGTSFTSEAREVVVDRTPPLVVARTPTPGAQNVSVHESIQVTFSEPVRLSTTNNDLVHLAQNSLDMPCTTALSTDGRSLTVTPSSALKAPSTATLSLNNTVTDLAGNSISLPVDPWVWQMPSWLIWGPIEGAIAPSADASLADYVLDSFGNPVIAWQVPSSPAAELYVYRWEGGSWNHLGGDLSVYPGNTPASEASIAIESSGQPVMAWRENDGTSNKILVRRWSNGSWAPLNGEASSTPTPTEGFWPKLQIDPSGSLFLTMMASQEPSYLLCVHRWGGTDWIRNGDCIDARTSFPDSPAILTFNPTGYPAIGWIGPTQGFSYILYRHWNGTEWMDLGDEAADLEQFVAYGSHLSMRISTSGHPLIAWTEDENSNYYIHTLLWSGTQWQSLGARIAVNSSQLPGHTLAIDNSGSPILAWSRLPPSGTGYQLHIWRWTGTEWSPISDPFTIQSLYGTVRIHPNQSGHLLISWAENRKVHFRRFNR